MIGNQCKAQLAIIYDDDFFTKEKASEDVNTIFLNLNSLNKGIRYQNNSDIIEIQNKYYACTLNFKIFSANDFICDGAIEGVMIYLHPDSMHSTNLLSVFSKLLSKKQENDGGKELCTSIVIFKEDRAHLSSLSYYDEFVGMTIDHQFEIISNILTSQSEDDDDGIEALNISLQSARWSNSNKNKPQKSSNEEDKEKAAQESKPPANDYQLMKDDIQYDQLIEKLNEMKRISKTENLTDEERRDNAERAVMMLAKMMKLDEDDEGECNENENDSDS